MLIDVHIPAYSVGGKDFPRRITPVNFPSLPPIGYGLSVLAQDEKGAWQRYSVSITGVVCDPGWSPGKEGSTVARDNYNGGYMYIEAYTNWIEFPGTRYRG